MITLPIPVEYVVDSIFIFLCFLLYQQLISENNIYLMNRYVIYSLFWGLISLLFEDYSYILFLMFFIMWDSIKQKKDKF